MLPDIYEGSLYRPPSEARSLILQATIGCSWNMCTFCQMYKEKRFRIKSPDEIRSDIDRIYDYYEDIDRIFLADGNALCIPTDHLLEILNLIYSRFENLERVTIYGGPKDIMDKSVEDLEKLKSAGLHMIYLGLESGSDEVLKRVKKGASSDMMIEAARKVKDSGIKLSVMVILGLGGQELSDVHAKESARVLSEMDPDYAAALTLLLEPGAPILEEIEKGNMTLVEPDQALIELRTIIKGSEMSNCVFRTNHPSNYIPVKGTLPRDRNMMLSQIDKALRRSDYRPEGWRAL